MVHFDRLKAIYGGSPSAERLEGGIETEEVNSLVSPGNEISNDLDLNGYENSEEDCQTSKLSDESDISSTPKTTKEDIWKRSCQPPKEMLYY